MEGDNLLIKPGHTVTATMILDVVGPDVEKSDKYTISVGGESGAGKSEVASELARLLEERGIRSGILHPVREFAAQDVRTCTGPYFQ